MSVFDLDVRGQAALDEAARMNPLDLSQAKPGFFTGTAEGLGAGVMRGGARVGQFLAMSAAAPLAIAEEALDRQGEFTDPYFRAVDEYVNSAVDYWTPAPAEVGKAGEVLGGLSEIVLPLMAGGGNPSLLIGAQEFGVATDLAREGVDPATAVAAGVAQGLSTAIGFKMPFLGKSLTTRLASGAGGNLAVNALTTAAQQQILERRGYAAIADRYDPFDVTARAVDILTGLAFGGLAHLGAPRMTSAQRAAVAAANDAKHFQSDTAPGAPTDVRSSVAHTQALETAIDQLSRGEPVNVPEAVTTADFVPRPDPNAGERVQGAVDELGPIPESPADTIEAPAVKADGTPEAPPELADVNIPTGEIDADGVPVSRPASKALAEIDAEIERVTNDAKGFKVAVTCLLERGE